MLLVRQHGAVAKNLPVALVVLPEQTGGKVVTAAVPLAAISVDLYLHRDIPLCTATQDKSRQLIRQLACG
jgi:hypothetical protein